MGNRAKESEVDRDVASGKKPESREERHNNNFRLKHETRKYNQQPR